MKPPIEQLPPQDIESEIGLLGSIMKKPEILSQVGEIVAHTDYYDTSHQILHTCMVNIWKREKSLDVILLRSELDSKGLLDTVGGFEMLADICNTVPGAANWGPFARIVKEKSLLRQAIAVVTNATKMLNHTNPETATEIIYGIAKQLTLIGQKGENTRLVTLPEVAKQVYEEVMAGKPSDMPVIATGMSQIDIPHLGGLTAGNVYTIGAYPGDGKTTMAVNWAMHQTRKGYRLLYVSKEMLESEIGRCCMASHLGVEFHKLTPPPPGRESSTWSAMTQTQLIEFKAMQDSDHKLSFLTGKCSPMTVESHLNKYRELGEPFDIVYIDHLHLMECSPQYIRESSVERLSSIGHELKTISTEYRVPVVLLVQLNREATGPPEMRNIKGSSAIEQISTSIFMNYTDPVGGGFKSYVRKGRFSGTGEIDLKWDKPRWLIKES